MFETLEIVVEEAILPDDKDLIGNSAEQITSLINSNPFADRIWFLLLNQRLATTPVVNKFGKVSAPNCLGTAFFVAGVSSLGYPYHGYDIELDEHMKQPTKIEENEDQSFFSYFHQHPERMVPGAFCFSFSLYSDDWHGGIYIGKVSDQDIMFAQQGHGGNFCFETMRRSYRDPKFYIPKTLQK